MIMNEENKVLHDKLGRAYHQHKYADGKPDREISHEEFVDAIGNAKIPKEQRAFIVLLYWVGCRCSEPLVILREDIEEKDNRLYISIHYRRDAKGERIPFSRAKRGQAAGPTELPLENFGVDLIKEIWQKTKSGKKVFPFTAKTGYRAFKEVFPKKTPHWVRYTRITRLRKRLGIDLTIDGIKSFTGIRRDSTIENYGLKTTADIHKIADMLD
jgi:integrase